jgi:hypothetical protein
VCEVSVFLARRLCECSTRDLSSTLAGDPYRHDAVGNRRDEDRRSQQEKTADREVDEAARLRRKVFNLAG